MAMLRWLTSQSDEDRNLLAAVTSIQVGKELLNRITNQDKVDAYKVPGKAVCACWQNQVNLIFCLCVHRNSAFWVLHSSSENILGLHRLTSVLRWRKEFLSLLLKSKLWRRLPYSEGLKPPLILLFKSLSKIEGLTLCMCCFCFTPL